jgi:mannose-6-phosphate isomerase-like protein (cupin superfamily)
MGNSKGRQEVSSDNQILPGTGRWQYEVLTEGSHLSAGICFCGKAGPLHRFAVPLPVPGRIGA